MPVNKEKPVYCEIRVKKQVQVSPVIVGLEMKCWSEGRVGDPVR